MYLGHDMFGRGALGISDMTVQGGAMRVNNGETESEARARYKRVNQLLKEWA